jgi:hypothetical protein
MTVDEFSRLADAWGGDIARWPEQFRTAAERIARTDVEAASILERVRAFDRLLVDNMPAVSDERAAAAARAVVSRLAAGSAGTSRAASQPLLLRWLVPAMSFACAAVLGIYLGFAYPMLGGPDNSLAGKALVMILEEDTALSWIQ